MINNRINNIRHVHEEKEFLEIEEKDGMSSIELKTNISDLLSKGISKKMIKEDLIPSIGFRFSSLPENIKSLLKE
jgi:hypothetical protein